MNQHLFVGGPMHGQLIRLATSGEATCQVQSRLGPALYNRQDFTHTLSHKQFVIYVHGKDWESWQVAQLLRQHGLL